MFNPQFTIHSDIRKQMLIDLDKKVDAWEIKSKASDRLLQGCFVDNEVTARRLASEWLECLTMGVNEVALELAET